MRYEDKPPGMTLAEALGIVVDPKAPGGQRMVQPSTPLLGKRVQNQTVESDYQGFTDIDGYNRRV